VINYAVVIVCGDIWREFRVKEDADACILWVKCMLDGQYAEILPPKKVPHWVALEC